MKYKVKVLIGIVQVVGWNCLSYDDNTQTGILTVNSGRGVIPDKELPMEKYVAYVKAAQDPELSCAMELIKAGGN